MMRWQWRVGAAVLAVLMAATAAIAQESPWEAPLLGAGIQVRQAYDGASDRRVSAIPMVRYARDPLFLRTTQGMLEGGARFRDPRGWSLGLLAAYEEGRPATDFTRGRGIEPVEAGVSFGGLAEFQGYAGPAPFLLMLRVRRVAAASRGIEADARVAAGIFSGWGGTAALYMETTWLDGTSGQSLYGVSAGQSAATGLQEHPMTPGLAHATAGLLWSLDLPGSWCLLGSAGERFLLGGARRSPLAERPSGIHLTLGAAYRL